VFILLLLIINIESKLKTRTLHPKDPRIKNSRSFIKGKDAFVSNFESGENSFGLHRFFHNHKTRRVHHMRETRNKDRNHRQAPGGIEISRNIDSNWQNLINLDANSYRCLTGKAFD